MENKKYINKYTGEVLPFVTVSSVDVDPGIENTGVDLCRKEDFEPISAVIKRFLRSADVLSVMKQEYAYDVKNLPSLDKDSAFDYVDQDDDVMTQQIDLEDYLDGRYASGASVSAVEAEQGASDERSQISEEQAPTEAEEKPSE